MLCKQILSATLLRATNLLRYWNHQRYVWGNKESNWSNTIQNSSSQVQKPVRLLLIQINRWRDGWNTIYRYMEQSHSDCTKCLSPANCLGRATYGTYPWWTGKGHQLSCQWKASGSGGIPPEIIKCGKPVLLKHLHKLLKLCWSEKADPQNMYDSNTRWP